MNSVFWILPHNFNFKLEVRAFCTRSHRELALFYVVCCRLSTYRHATIRGIWFRCSCPNCVGSGVFLKGWALSAGSMLIDRMNFGLFAFAFVARNRLGDVDADQHEMISLSFFSSFPVCHQRVSWTHFLTELAGPKVVFECEGGTYCSFSSK